MAHKIESIRPEPLLVGYEADEFTPVDTINKVYDRIDEYDDKSVWITLATRASALEYAKHLMAQFKTIRPRPPLYGVPFSVKDNIDVAGYPTTLGFPAQRSRSSKAIERDEDDMEPTMPLTYTARSTARIVQKLLDAGAIFLGKTNMDQLSVGLSGTHADPTRGNPACVYDHEYAPGGSSSGAAVSVAAGFASFAIATDTAGGARIPAAWNGIVCLKPTLGTVSGAGVVPACRMHDAVAILAKGVNGARRVWEVIRAYDGQDAFARRTLPLWPRPWPDEGMVIRFGTPTEEVLRRFLDPDYARLFDDVLETMEREVGCVRGEEFDYMPFQQAGEMWFGSSMTAQRLVALEEHVARLTDSEPQENADGIEAALEQVDPAIREIILMGQGQESRFSAQDAWRDLFALQELRRDAEVQFRDCIDVLVVPSTIAHFTVAEVDEDPIGKSELMGTFTYFVNLLDLCALAVPAGTWRNANGAVMPFGVTLVAQAGRDKELMELGQKMTDII